MIKVFNKECTEKGLAVKYITYYFFGIKIYESISTTTNSNIIYQLTPRVSKPKIEGFNNKENETKN